MLHAGGRCSSSSAGVNRADLIGVKTQQIHTTGARGDKKSEKPNKKFRQEMPLNVDRSERRVREGGEAIKCMEDAEAASSQ